MGLLAKSPVACEDRLLVSETAASNLLVLAAQMALQVGHSTEQEKAKHPEEVFVSGEESDPCF